MVLSAQKSISGWISLSSGLVILATIYRLLIFHTVWPGMVQPLPQSEQHGIKQKVTCSIKSPSRRLMTKMLETLPFSFFFSFFVAFSARWGILTCKLQAWQVWKYLSRPHKTLKMFVHLLFAHAAMHASHNITILSSTSTAAFSYCKFYIFSSITQVLIKQTHSWA